MSEWVRVAAPKLKRDWVRRKVRINREVRTQQAVIPAGALGRIEHHSPGTSTVILDVCKCCGISPVVRFDDVSSSFEFVAQPSEVSA